MSSLNWVDYVLLMGVLFSVYTDVKTRKIKNYITFPLMALGIIYNTISLGGAGTIFSIKGLVLCGIISLLMASFNGIEMGDAKLLMGIGAIKGFPFTINVLVFSFFASVILTLILSPRKFIIAMKNIYGMVKAILYGYRQNITEKESALKLAYAVYIFIALIATYLIGGDWLWVLLTK